MSQPLPTYNSIAGLSPREPIAAVLTVGTKGTDGTPTLNDRFFFKTVHQDKIGGRPEHPDFKAWHAAPAERRQSVRGHLVHATQAECFQYGLRAQVISKPAHPNMLPHCTGDGITATRLHVIEGEWTPREIPCPNSLCEFRQGQRPACKPAARLYFSTRWNTDPAIPNVLVKLTTQSWNSISAFLGFFEHLHATCEQLGIENVSLYGLPFTINLQRKTKPSAKANFPVMTISPAVDVLEFFAKQREKLLQAGQLPRMIATGASTPEENDPAIVALDIATVQPGVSKPSAIVDVADAEIVEESQPATVGGLTREKRETILEAGRKRGMSLADIERASGAELMTAPAEAETEILRAIRDWGKR